MIRTTTITLRIKWNDLDSEHPTHWNWWDLLDLGSGKEDVEVVSFVDTPQPARRTVRPA